MQASGRDGYTAVRGRWITLNRGEPFWVGGAVEVAMSHDVAALVRPIYPRVH